jgi:thiol-disulfide isomerase/thioredoxin
MKKRLLLPILILSTSIATLQAADPEPTAPAPTPAAPATDTPAEAPAPKPASDPAAAAAQVPSLEDLSKFKTADELYAYFETVQKEPAVKAKSREEFVAIATKYFSNVAEVAGAFAKTYPADSRRYKAMMAGFNADVQLRRFNDTRSDGAADRARLDAIINAADAPEAIKNEAAYTRVITYTADLSKGGAAYLEFHKAVADFLAANKDPKMVMRIRQAQIQVLQNDPTKEGGEVLTALATDTDPNVAGAAGNLINKRKIMAELKSKPVELDFTAASGRTVDLAMMRGKVVLVDFWASWCGPCMEEMPNVVATYEKLHESGFEIVGINMDDDKTKMLNATKRMNMNWPQYYDGLAWQNKISRRFGIDAIPAAWLIDKKGMLRETNLRGPELGAAVEKLLKE